MRNIVGLALLVILAASANSCSSSSSAQAPNIGDVAVPVVPAALTPLSDGRMAFTGARIDSNFPDVWVTDFTAENTRLLLEDAEVLTHDGSYNGKSIKWSGLALLTSHDGEDGGLFWLSDGTDSGTMLVADFRDIARHFQVTNAEVEGRYLFISGVYYDPPFTNRADQVFRLDLSSVVP